jgi:uncharacterized protein
MKASRYNQIIEKDNYLILFNTLSNAILYVEPNKVKQVKETLEMGDVENSKLSGEEIVKLEKGFYLLPDDFNELTYLKMRLNNYKYSDRFLRYTICLTDECNFACTYCYQQMLNALKGNKPVKISDEKISNILAVTERKFNEERPKVLSVTFYGGEPLLAVDQIEKLSNGFLNLCEKYDVKYDTLVVTNGYLLTVPVIQRLLECGVNSAIVTIDGDRDLHNSYRKHKSGRPTFDTIMGNVGNAQNRMYITIRTNVSKNSVENANTLIKILAEKGWRVDFDFQPVEVVEELSTGFNDEMLTLREFASVEAELYKEVITLIPEYSFNPFRRIKYARCDALCRNSFVIDVDGSIYKCWGEIGNKFSSVGKLTNEDIELNHKFEKWITYEPFEDQKCMECPVLPMCMGGCVFNAVTVERLSASPWKKPYACIPWKYNLKEMVSLVAEQKLRKKARKEE